MDASSGRELLRWMASFDMEGLLLRQLLALKPRVWERACCGMFSGGWQGTAQLLWEGPSELCPRAAAALCHMCCPCSAYWVQASECLAGGSPLAELSPHSCTVLTAVQHMQG